MSIDIDWPSITTGPDGEALALRIRDFLDDRFQTVKLPRFLQSVRVHEFRFGDVCPQVTLRDVCDPLPEFYESDGEDGDSNGGSGSSSGSSSEGPSAGDRGLPAEPSRAVGARGARGDLTSNPSTTARTTLPPSASNATTPLFPFLDTSRAGLRYGLGSSTSAGLSTPTMLYGPSPTMSYFNLPLQGSGAPHSQHPFSGAATPLTGLAGAMPPPPMSSRHRRESSLSSPPASRPSTARSRPQPRSRSPSPSRSPPRHRRAKSPSPSDLQIVLSTSYSGPIHLDLTASILLDYPMPSFVEIPLRLKIRHVTFEGAAVVAVVGRVVHACFLGREDEAVLVGELVREDDGDDGEGDEGMAGERDGEDELGERVEFIDVQGRERARDGRPLADPALTPISTSTISSSSTSSTTTATATTTTLPSSTTASPEEDHDPTSLLTSIRVESSIGKEDTLPGGKQALKNVQMVERFVLGQVRRIFEEELVWPSFWSFLV